MSNRTVKGVVTLEMVFAVGVVVRRLDEATTSRDPFRLRELI
ncbi:MAG: hypothetical protein AAGD22_18075 [Verrucomicrobiota bacterium]